MDGVLGDGGGCFSGIAGHGGAGAGDACDGSGLGTVLRVALAAGKTPSRCYSAAIARTDRVFRPDAARADALSDAIGFPHGVSARHLGASASANGMAPARVPPFLLERESYFARESARSRAGPVRPLGSSGDSRPWMERP